MADQRRGDQVLLYAEYEAEKRRKGDQALLYVEYQAPLQRKGDHVLLYVEYEVIPTVGRILGPPVQVVG